MFNFRLACKSIINPTRHLILDTWIKSTDLESSHMLGLNYWMRIHAFKPFYQLLHSTNQDRSVEAATAGGIGCLIKGLPNTYLHLLLRNFG